MSGRSRCVSLKLLTFSVQWELNYTCLLPREKQPKELGRRNGLALASEQCGLGSIPARCYGGLNFVVGSLLCTEGFFQVFRFSSLHKNQHPIQLDRGPAWKLTRTDVSFLSKYCNTPEYLFLGTVHSTRRWFQVHIYMSDYTTEYD